MFDEVLGRNTEKLKEKNEQEVIQTSIYGNSAGRCTPRNADHDPRHGEEKSRLAHNVQ